MPITDIYTDMPLNISTDPDTDIGLIGFTDTNNISVLYQYICICRYLGKGNICKIPIYKPIQIDRADIYTDTDSGFKN